MKEKKNPFTLAFGKEPTTYISRFSQTNNIIETFDSDNPTHQVYMITGVRGSGKTVLLTHIAKEMMQKKDWITEELNTNGDLLHSLAAKLYAEPELYPLFIEAKFNLSAFGLGAEFKNSPPITDIETALTRMLERIKKHGKKLLICIDEVTPTDNVKLFASAFQIFMRADLPVFLLMTGLYDNINNLQNDKTLTFLYRAPKVIPEPLNLGAIANSYRDLFEIDDEVSMDMAKLTNGYSFAFQVLGFLCWENGIDGLNNKLLEIYDQYLEEYVYSKIWSELSSKDRDVVMELADNITIVKDIREKLEMKPGDFSVYRDRLLKKGIIVTPEYGRIELSLPRFAAFVNRYK